MAFRTVELYNDGQSSNDADGLITGPLPGQENDVVVVAAVLNSGVATMTLTDDGDAGNTWTTISSPEPDVINSNTDVYVWAKALTATDVGATVSIDASVGAIRFVGIGVAFSGRDTTIANLVTGRAQDTSAGTTLTAAGVTATAGDDVLNVYITRAGLGSQTTLSDPDTMTTAGESNTNFGASPNLSAVATYLENVSAGTQGDVAATFNQNVTGIIYTVGIPASSGTGHTENPDDDLGLDDALALTYGRLPGDDEDLTDSATITQGRLPADDLGLTDAATITQGRLPADDLGLTDAVALGFGRLPADDLGLTDSATTGGTSEQPQDDDLGLTDAVVAIAGQLVDDELGLTDAVALTRDTFLDVSDALGLTEAVALGYERTPADDLGLTDHTTVQISPKDALGLTDSVTTAADFLLSFGDDLGLLDATADIAPGYLPGVAELVSPGHNTALVEESLSTAELLDQLGAAVLAASTGTAVIDT